MKLCGRYSISDAAHSIAIGDLIFSVAAILVHILEATDSSQEKLNQSWALRNSSQVSVLGAKYDMHYRQIAITALCWIYLGINSSNFLLAILLWQAVSQESVLKCVSYLVISSFVLIFGLAVFLFHVLVMGKYPHYFALAMYPVYWMYKSYALLVVKCYLHDLKQSSGLRKTRRRRHDDGNVEYDFSEESSSDEDIYSTKSIRGTMFSQLFSLEKYGIQRTTAKSQELERLLSFEADGKYIIQESSLKIDHNKLLESEEYTATIRGVLKINEGEFLEVAAKTLKVTSPTIPHGKRLMEEAKLLAHIGAHENIVKFLGVYKKPSPKEKLFLVTESYPMGKLDLFLKDCEDLRHSRTFTNFVDESGIIDSRVKPSDSRDAGSKYGEFDTFSMLLWAYQIASAIEYLHSKKVIVGCIQAKDVAVINPKLVKISGTALPTLLHVSRKTLKRDNLPVSENRFPWRWSALECMAHMDKVRFTIKSDSWSYGVLLWEIFSFCRVPYADWTVEIVKGLQRKMRLKRPDKAPEELYEIMCSCWLEDPKERPTFNLLRLFLKHLVPSQ